MPFEITRMPKRILLLVVLAVSVTHASSHGYGRKKKIPVTRSSSLAQLRKSAGCRRPSGKAPSSHRDRTRSNGPQRRVEPLQSRPVAAVRPPPTASPQTVTRRRSNTIDCGESGDDRAQVESAWLAKLR